MTCPRIDDAGAYVLRALEEREAEDYARHLQTCDECRLEVAGLRPVADTLPLAAPVEMPPEALRGRIMAIVESEAELLRATGPQADRPKERRERRRPLAWLGSLRPLPAAALASVLLVVGIGAGVLINSSGGPSTKTTTAQVAARGATAVVRTTGDRTELAVARMPAPPEGRRIYLRADRGLDYGRVMRVMGELNRAGLNRVALVSVGDQK